MIIVMVLASVSNFDLVHMFIVVSYTQLIHEKYLTTKDNKKFV